MQSTWAITEDLSSGAVWLTALLLLAGLSTLVAEQRRRGGGALVLLSGILALVALALAVLRPVHVRAKSTQLGPRVVVLVDQSRRMKLPLGSRDRATRASTAVRNLQKHFKRARLSLYGFGEGPLEPYDPQRRRLPAESDLSTALQAVSNMPTERPAAVVVVSDGRLLRPVEDVKEEALRQSLQLDGIAVHTVAVATKSPKDASIRQVKAAGAAVAHQPLAITVQVACAEQLECEQVPITIRELLNGESPLKLASGAVRIKDGIGSAEFEVTLDRAGTRVLEVSISPPDGDAIPENNKRFVTFSVAKQRVRLLHLAGRPTYDVRALRTWLKSDESVDVVAFFILRGETDDPGATERELALIRFPVHELFTEHLPSFDAVILQDIDAVRYKLARYLVGLENYVKKGGGLIMVGGPSSFGGGNYAGTPLDGILPVEQPRDGKPFDPGEFIPRYTPAGLAAPVTRELRTLLANQLPPLSGANLLGVARPGAIVLWEHPTRSAGGRGMPVLALGEAGDGRSIALGVDSTARLAFGQLASGVAGRAYGALWDGLLGWLMRDPRYEAARVELVGECLVGQPTRFRIHRLPGMAGDVRLSLEPLGGSKRKIVRRELKDDHRASIELEVEGLKEGGYAARVVIGAAPATRQDFGCERAGRAWRDSRPDPERLQAIASASGGKYVRISDIESLPHPPVKEVVAQRSANPVLPPWGWSLAAATLLGAHWLARRRGGLS